MNYPKPNVVRAALVRAESENIMQNINYGQEIILPKGNYILESAVNSVSMEPKTNGYYPRWVGSTMELTKLYIGYPTVFRYIKDNEGHDWEGGMRTSSVLDYNISLSGKNVVIATVNTIYTFNKIEED